MAAPKIEGCASPSWRPMTSSRPSCSSRAGRSTRRGRGPSWSPRGPARSQAVKHDEKTERVKVDRTLEQVKPDDFDALLLPGGALNADALRVNQRAQELVRAMDQAGKPIALICHAPWLLIPAGLVRGRAITSYHTIRDDLRNAGARWEDREVIRDRNWVSSRQPSDIPEFNRAMLGLFYEYHLGGAVGKAD